MSMILLNRIGEKPIELQYVVDKNLPKELIGDSVRIRQIIINLTNNAIKFTDRGHVRLAIDVKKTGPDTIDLTVTVADTGQGISKENLPKLFSDFQQVDQLKNRNKEGTGLGLSLSRKLRSSWGYNRRPQRAGSRQRILLHRPPEGIGPCPRRPPEGIGTGGPPLRRGHLPVEGNPPAPPKHGKGLRRALPGGSGAFPYGRLA